MELPDFDMVSIPLDATICIVGKRATGKTTLIRHILDKRCKDMYGVTITSEHDVSTDDWVSEIVDKQRTTQEHSYVVLDDAIVLDRNRRSLAKLIANSRRLKVMVILAVQYLPLLTPSMRANMDIYFLMDERDPYAKEYLWNLVGSPVSRDTFYKVLDEDTKDYGAIVARSGTLSRYRVT